MTQLLSLGSYRPLPASLAVRLRANFVPSLVWSFLFYMQVIRLGFPPSLPNLLIAAVNFVYAAFFLTRTDPVRTGNRQEMLLALSGTAIVAFLPKANEPSTIATIIQISGLLAWIGSLIALGRSLGIAPADRGLKQRGPYSLVRHPVYASELIFFFGFWLASASLMTTAILIAWWALQVLRILREERIISGYEIYRASVRWRVIPGVW